MISPPKWKCPRCGSVDVKETLDAVPMELPTSPGLRATCEDLNLVCRTCHLHNRSWRLFTNTADGFADVLARSKPWRHPDGPLAHEDFAMAPRFVRDPRWPWNETLLADVNADPEDDEARLAYAAWMRHQPVVIGARGYPSAVEPTAIADFIERSVAVARALRDNPRADLRPLMTWDDSPGRRRWRNGGVIGWGVTDFIDNLGGLYHAGLEFYRGFIEHVRMPAREFFYAADELFALAPIRHLTLLRATDCLTELLSSPNLRRIRSLRMPCRDPERPGYPTLLGSWSDEQVAALAESPNLANLRYLSFDDADHLTVRAFISLATSPHLKQLSHVAANRYRYTDEVDGSGEHKAYVDGRATVDFRREIEAVAGYVPWLHPSDHYGTLDPEIEAVVEHPIALNAKVAARRGQPVR